MVINIAIGSLVIACTAGALMVRRMRVRGPMETAAAEVLSLSQWGPVSANTAVPRTLYRIRLRVQSAGREPYNATVWRSVDPWDNGAIEPGRTVAVEIDVTNPKRVRIDLNRPLPQRTEPHINTIPPAG
jgi:hypothetical protein